MIDYQRKHNYRCLTTKCSSFLNRILHGFRKRLLRFEVRIECLGLSVRFLHRVYQKQIRGKFHKPKQSNHRVRWYWFWQQNR